MKWLNLLCAALLLGLAGCKPKTSAVTGASYDGRGVIQQIAADRRTVTIAHEDIPGYMMAMTMDFAVKDTNELNGLSPGDQVTFKLVVRANDDWVEHLLRTGQTNRPAPILSPVAASELKPGDLMPDFEFTGEDGARRHLADFRGQALAFTFFFTSCPLPNYCPRMNRNFGEARQLLETATNAPARWQFLSLSFDPNTDTPETLSNYAGLYRGGDPNHWLFAVISPPTLAAVAPRLDLMVVRGSAGISHNLRTVVLDPQGRIRNQFDGNEWTPQQLADAVRAAAGER